ncbi:MAG TPA: ABC transporter ATP-binding protein [Solimonas sp.]|nr:ABC transporter ATP-binding protein [Solimonas sp.]
MSASAEPVIEVKGLTAHYGKKKILSDVDLAVEPGEIRVIMGGSGSGKSTLLRHMLGLERPTRGTVQVLGVDIRKARGTQWLELRKKIGVAFQTGALFSSMSVGENIMLPLREHAHLDENTMRIMMRLKLEFVNLQGCEDLMPAQLSGGMVKRAALARATIMDPRILFFDEPSAGLDPVVAASLDELMLKLRDATGTTLVVVTHELDSAFKIADRITVLDQGEVLETGTVDQVKASDNDRVQALLTRRVEQLELNPEEYLRQLTGQAPRESRSAS